MARVYKKVDSRKYQNKIAAILRGIFGKELVKTEWDSVQYDGHTSNHSRVYAPRHDIAVGPINSYMNLDIGDDKTKKMQSHPFTKKLIKSVLSQRETIDKIWNPFSRCFLAIEIDFSGSDKHILGSIINATVSGSIGIVVTNREKFERAKKLANYMLRLEGLERIDLNVLRNLIIFEQKDFIYFLQTKSLRSYKSELLVFLEQVSGKIHLRR